MKMIFFFFFFNKESFQKKQEKYILNEFVLNFSFDNFF